LFEIQDYSVFWSYSGLKYVLRKAKTMQKYVCSTCGHVYDPEDGDPGSGIPPGTLFEDLPEDWVCPVCGASKDDFEPE
jgi:rubredoxin